MKERDKLTLSELDAMLAMYQSLTTIFTFFAGFVFVTIPLIIFSAEISSLYGRLIIYFLLTSLLIFNIIIDLYHSATLRVYRQTSPKTFRIFLKYPEPRIADRLFEIGMLFASSPISLMLFLKDENGQLKQPYGF